MNRTQDEMGVERGRTKREKNGRKEANSNEDDAGKNSCKDLG